MKYVALQPLRDPVTRELYQVGAEIELTKDKATVLLAAGLIEKAKEAKNGPNDSNK